MRTRSIVTDQSNKKNSHIKNDPQRKQINRSGTGHAHLLDYQLGEVTEDDLIYHPLFLCPNIVYT